MNSTVSQWHNAAAPEEERPSAEFIRAVADLLETDADDILSELGYTYGEAVVSQVQPIEV
jgi:hypothetical protein